jgi:peptidoglycan/LPS O-acetylase OafA/YrhL
VATSYSVPSRFFSLDVLRGTLTFFIILFHWQHFFYDGVNQSPDFVRTDQPFYEVLTPLYTQGIYAVDFFFSLSGFIFFWLYGESIATGRVSAYKYTAYRFSRLYPLHAVTLVFVIIAQRIAFAETGQYVVYPENDWYHLFLNIFFINAWGVEKGFSFNGPAWTVSVEVLMYIAFFAVAYFGMAGSLLLAASISLIGFYITHHVNMPIGTGLHSFFIGGVTYILYTKLLRFNLKYALYVLSPLCVLIWTVAVIDMYTGIAPNFKAHTPAFLHGLIDTFDSSLFATIVVIPSTLLFLAVAETVRGTLGRRAHVIGDLSYALYLLHFPLQMAFILGARWLGIDRSFFYTASSLFLFYAVLFPLSYCSYYYFEVPMQQYLRQLFLKRSR